METDIAILNPFPGLRAFEEDEDILFFGREKQIDELLRKLRTSRFLAIIGSSGSGKSSLVRSGLLPSLHSGLMSGVGSQWRVALFRPGIDPIGQMNLALSKDGVLREYSSKEEQDTSTAINETILRRSNLGLVESYKQSGLNKKNNLLVLVDQFEEIFRFSKYEKEAGEGKRDSIAFINLLLKAAGQKEYPIYVVFTMRSDFLGDCTEFRGLPEAINDGQYLVPRMTREERREAITGPIAVGGGSVTPALVNRLLNDVGDNPDQLPILQHAMMRTWNQWKSKNRPDEPIDIDDYESIGTISEALSQHAEEAFAELASDRERLICETIFKELTDKGGLSSGIRRPRLLSELCAAAAADTDEVKAVIEVFRKPGRGFLMPAFPAPLTPKSIIDISHESIMRVWKRLMTWLDEEDEAAQVYLHLCEAVNLYESGKGGLWRDPELQIALKWKEEQNKNAAWASRYNNYFDKVIFFLEHSRQQRDLEVKHKEELQKQRLRITRRVSVVVSIIALIAFMMAIVAFNLKGKANKAEAEALKDKQNAITQQKKADSSAIVAVNEKQAALYAKARADSSAVVAINEKKNAEKQEGIAKKESYLARIAEAFAVKSKEEAKRDDSVARESEARAKASEEQELKAKTLAITEKENALRLQKLAESKNEAHQAVLSMNEKLFEEGLKSALAAYNSNKNNKGSFQDNDIYNALYASWANSINDQNHKSFHNGPVRALAGLPVGDMLFSADETGVIITSRYKDGVLQRVSFRKTGGEVRSLAVCNARSAMGDMLLAVLMQEAVLYEISSDGSLKERERVTLTGMGRHGVFLDAMYFLVQTTEGVMRFEANKGTKSGDLVKIADCSALAIGSSNKIFIASGKNISEYASWDKIPAKPLNVFPAPSQVTCICLDAQSEYLAAGTSDGGVWLKNMRSDSKPFYSNLHRSKVNDVKFSSVGDGKLQLASASSDKFVKLTEVDRSADILKVDDMITLQEHSSWVYTLFYSADGKYLFSGSEDRSIIGWPTTMAGIYNSLKK